jgi:hypothetical protein
MKALTLHQPWAQAIAWMLKMIETRSWSTKYRGPLAIHAGANHRSLYAMLHTLYKPDKVIPGSMEAYFEDYLRQHVKLQNWRASFALTSVVAIVNLVDVVPTESLTNLTVQERAFGNFDPGRYAWILDDVKPVANPFYAKGFQRLWTWDDSRYDLPSLYERH